MRPQGLFFLCLKRQNKKKKRDLAVSMRLIASIFCLATFYSSGTEAKATESVQETNKVESAPEAKATES
ncbi:hypothetical protein AAGX01_13605, partial [Staphylococcus aureus]